MNVSQRDISLFSNLRFILVETSHPGNIGMVARAMKTMGFSRLVLVRPRLPGALTHESAIQLASNAVDILENAEVVDSVEEALKDCRFACAVTSRFREFSPPIIRAREAAVHIAAHPDLNPALVFGSEKYGLPNETVEKCHAMISIPANPDYASLNLAQAVQILAYECRMALPQDVLPDQNVESAGFEDIPASVSQIDGMLNHLEEALTTIGFLNEHSPKKLMPRLRRLFARSALEVDEINILRGIASQIMKKKRPDSH
ncbi:RNA methyltransferase [Oxalobacter vibrioformis]|uniref:tRNA (cytidine/uridine-2'-O-)-methyltransferase TrmJ n=1 Tax=Oxalobacter vibrioformis TaxID=933080 RepID=A0A9E9LVT2_9BURK|nr:RNA methyltransferase [Oxalobacter vibrioformis]NLC24242.1 RNA methyltransferase [Oxalobacter sp.]WAW09769.1 RNA methyltransferase [Oxalobacter vibrioformis]